MNQTEANKLDYQTMLQDRGQMVEVAYCHHEDGYLYCRSYDRSDRKLSITRSAVVGGLYQPWNGVLPETGEAELLT